MNKEIFYKKMKPYFEQNLVREIYSNDTFCIINVGEIQYVGMLYEFPKEGVPYGIKLGSKVAEKCINNNLHFYELLNLGLDNYEECKKVFATFFENQIDDWKKIIAKYQRMKKTFVDYDMEERIKEMTNKKTK